MTVDVEPVVGRTTGTRLKAEEARAEMDARIREVGERARRPGYDPTVRTRQATPEELARLSPKAAPASHLTGTAARVAASSRRDRMVAWLEDNGPATTAEIGAAFELTHQRAGVELAAIARQGRAARDGHIPSTKGRPSTLWVAVAVDDPPPAGVAEGEGGLAAPGSSAESAAPSTPLPPSYARTGSVEAEQPAVEALPEDAAAAVVDAGEEGRVDREPDVVVGSASGDAHHDQGDGAEFPGAPSDPPAAAVLGERVESFGVHQNVHQNSVAVAEVEVDRGELPGAFYARYFATLIWRATHRDCPDHVYDRIERLLERIETQIGDVA